MIPPLYRHVQATCDQAEHVARHRPTLEKSTLTGPKQLILDDGCIIATDVFIAGRVADFFCDDRIEQVSSGSGPMQYHESTNSLSGGNQAGWVSRVVWPRGPKHNNLEANWFEMVRV